MGENATEAEMAAPLENGAAEVAAPPAAAAPPPVAVAAAPAVGGIAMVAMPLLQQTGEVFCGPGSRKEAQLLGLGLTKLRSRQKDALQDAKRYAMDISIKQIMMRQQEAHQKNQQKQAMYAQAISLMGRVYIGSISFEVREDMLRKAFECFGPIKSINLSYDNSTGLHKGFAFLEYDVPEAALLCQEAMNGVLMGGRNLKVGRPSNMPQAGPIIDMVQQEAKLYHRVYVSSVHPDLSEADLKSVFEAFGEVKKCQLARQGVTGKGSHRGFGYIEFTNAASANEAIAGMNMFDLGGQFLRVGRCITPPDALTAIVPQATVNLPNAAALAAAAVTAQIQATEIQKGATAGSQSPGQLALTDGSQSPAAAATPPPAAPSPVKAIAPAPVPPPPPQQLAIGGAPALGTPPPPPGYGSPMQQQQDPYVPAGYGQMAGGVAPPPPAPVPPPPPMGGGTPPSQSFGSPAAAAAGAPSRRSGFGGFAAAPPPGAVANVPPPGIVGGAAPPPPPVGVAGGSTEGEGGEPKMSAAAARRARKKESMLKGNVLDRIQLSSFDASAPAQFGVADPLTAPKDPLSDEAAMLMLEGGGKQSIEDVQSMALALLEGSGAVMNVKKKAEAAAAAALEAAGLSNANKQPRAKIKKPKAVKGPQLNTAQALAAAHTAGALSDAVVNATVNAEDATLASQEGMQIRGNDARHLLMTKLMRTNRSCVLLLKNMVAADEIDEYLEEEIKEETGKYGHVEEVIIAADEQSNSVKIFVRFAEAQQADAAKAALDNRFFGGKTISAAIYDQALFDHGDLTG